MEEESASKEQDIFKLAIEYYDPPRDNCPGAEAIYNYCLDKLSEADKTEYEAHAKECVMCQTDEIDISTFIKSDKWKSDEEAIKDILERANNS